MATNDFIGFASAGSANIMSQADYAAAAEQTDGVQPGPASSALANKAWRQGANMAAAIGQIMSDTGYNALDDGDIATLKTNLANALSLSKTYDIVTSGNISVPDNTGTDILSYTFSKTGVYCVCYSLNFRKVSSTGYRQLVVSATSGGSNIDQSAVLASAPPSAGFCFVQLSRLEKITTANTVRYLIATQTTGLTIDVSGQITVTRLGDV